MKHWPPPPPRRVKGRAEYMEYMARQGKKGNYASYLRGVAMVEERKTRGT